MVNYTSLSEKECFLKILELQNSNKKSQTRDGKSLYMLEIFEYLDRIDVFSFFDKSDEFYQGFRRAVCEKIVDFMKKESEFYLMNADLLNRVIEMYAFFPLEELLA